MNFKEILHHNYPVSDEAAKALYNACLLTTVRHGESIIQQGKCLIIWCLWSTASSG